MTHINWTLADRILEDVRPGLINLRAFTTLCGTGAPAASKTLAIRHISAKIVVDGRLDEPVWQSINPVTDFTQTSPDLGKPISERTEALIFYDDDNLYGGFRCYDSEPKEIRNPAKEEILNRTPQGGLKLKIAALHLVHQVIA